MSDTAKVRVTLGLCGLIVICLALVYADAFGAW